MEEIREQIKAEESSTQACHYCKTAKGTLKCSRCALPYCSKDCQRSHYPAHRAYCDGLAEMVSKEGVEDKDLVQKSGSVVQFKSHKWFAKHKVEIALLARALIPPQAHLTQVLLLVLSECGDCHLGSCTCQGQSAPPGGFRIVKAMIEVRPGIPRPHLASAVEELIRRAVQKGAVLSPMGRLVAMTDKNDNSVVQFCFTDTYEDNFVQHRQYTATELLRVINRDEEYAVPEMRKQMMVPPCAVLLTYKGVDASCSADVQDIDTFNRAAVYKMQKPAGRRWIRAEWEHIRARVNAANPTVQGKVQHVQQFLVERQMVSIHMESGMDYESAVAAVAAKLASGVADIGYDAAVAAIAEHDRARESAHPPSGEKGSQGVRGREKARMGEKGGDRGDGVERGKGDMTELELDALAAEIDAMGTDTEPTKPKKGKKKKGKGGKGPTV